MTVFDDCPHVDEREAEEIEVGTLMSVGDYERKLDREQDVRVTAPLARTRQFGGRRNRVRRGAANSPAVAVMHPVPHIGSKPRPRASEKGIEYVDPCVVERVKGMPPLDKGEDQ